MTDFVTAVELKPCPFCGASIHQFCRIGSEHFVTCSACSGTGPGAEREDEAAVNWNCRALPTLPDNIAPEHQQELERQSQQASEQFLRDVRDAARWRKLVEEIKASGGTDE